MAYSPRILIEDPHENQLWVMSLRLYYFKSVWLKFLILFFRELYAREESKELAVKTFQDHRSFYHPIAAAQIAKDLNLT